MTLSEAIRLGSMTGGQAFGTMKDMHGNTCALGAAREAVGVTAWLAMKCQLMRYPAQCPVCNIPCVVSFGGLLDYSLYGTIGHLNDEHRWTRLQIANFVETIELAPTVPGDTEVPAIRATDEATAPRALIAVAAQ